jgi:hypothetical protein
MAKIGVALTRSSGFVASSLVLAVLPGLWMAGCGSPGAPEPPSLNLPAPITNLTAVRVNNTVQLSWTTPTHTTDHIALKHPVATQICRAVESGPCTVIGTLPLTPGAAGSYQDTLPAELRQGSPRLLRYEVAGRNRAGKTAPATDPAFSAAGPAPAAITDAAGLVRSDGVVLSWQPAPEDSVVIRIHREWLSAPKTDEKQRSPMSSPPVPTQQTLLVHLPNGTDPGHAVDTSALSNQKYRYVFERVVSFKLSSKEIDVQGQSSKAIDVATTDVFPPAMPQGLVAVADTAGNAIDLSWTPNSDSDLAGYRVYRRDIHGSEPAQRIAALSLESSYRDATAQTGHTYGYSLSATDQSGNESPRSAETVETLPSP